VSAAGSLILRGFLLGWSVAWPPGPINAEMIRRALSRGFASAFAVGLGACSGDALWAIAVALGAGVLIGPRSRALFGIVSVALLLLLAAIFLRGAYQAWRERRSDVPPAETRWQSPRGGYLLGLGMALTSPWNMAFWFAVIGGSASENVGIGGALLLAAAVILGAASWCVVIGTASAWLGIRFGGPVWNLIAKGTTGLLMLGFAAEGAVALAAT
jgi:threonine/homoserine/homoserine lactone efflux protein